MRICIVYDCLYPWTVGGAERWYRNLAQRLTADGHEVTYLTLRQWPSGTDPGVSGVDVRAVGPRMVLYTSSGRRRILPPLVFGLGVLVHLLRHGRRYDVVHTGSFPYFGLLAAGALRPRGRYALVVDWHEVWTRAYWEEYLGRVGGAVGWAVQRACTRIPQTAFCFSRLHAARLREEGLRGEPTVLEGEYAGDAEPGTAPLPAGPSVVFAGRHISEKQLPALIPAFALAHEAAPELRLDVYGDGPERGAVEGAIRAAGLEAVARVHGFVDAQVVDDALRHAVCMVLPSRREGYGMVVVESAARGTPSVVVDHPDNAATELVEDGVNGVLAPSGAPADLAAAILRVRAAGHALRESTARWYAHNAARLSLGGSLDRVSRAYGSAARGR